MMHIKAILLSLFFSFYSLANEPEWAIYWYLCGSDLETDHQAASRDLLEMIEAHEKKPLKNVQIVVQTGGAKKWHIEGIGDKDKSIRLAFGHDLDEIEEVDVNDDVNMGDQQSLEEFLQFCKENYPAKKTMLLIWNHGGGSVDGVAVDENHDNKALSLKEIRDALHEIYPTDEKEGKHFEIIGFDACLMATLETAMAVKDHANYLVASEELEPSCGWNYTDFLLGLAKKPQMKGDQLGKLICDTYVDACKKHDVYRDITLSVVDCSHAEAVFHAVNILALYMIDQANESSEMFGKFGRAIKKSEKYGPNSKSSGGYTNMVDLGTAVKNLGKIDNMQDASALVLEILDEAVVYKVNGPYRRSSGLSYYYPLDSCKDNYKHLFSFIPNSALMCFYGWQHGFISSKGSEKVTDMLIDAISESEKFLNQYGEDEEISINIEGSQQAGSIVMDDINVNISEMADIALALNKSGDVTLNIPEKYMPIVDSIEFNLLYVDMEGDGLVMFLGSDSDLKADWEKGVFSDTFSGKWPCLQGELLSVVLMESNEDFNVYNSPIKLNGRRLELEFIYDFRKNTYEIIGARPTKENGVVSRELIPLKEGDKVTLLITACTLEDSSNPVEVESSEIVIASDCAIAEEDMGDGQFGYMFEIYDIQGNSVTSDMAFITVNGDEITTSVGDDEESDDGDVEPDDEDSE